MIIHVRLQLWCQESSSSQRVIAFRSINSTNSPVIPLNLFLSFQSEASWNCHLSRWTRHTKLGSDFRTAAGWKALGRAEIRPPTLSFSINAARSIWHCGIKASKASWIQVSGFQEWKVDWFILFFLQGAHSADLSTLDATRHRWEKCIHRGMGKSNPRARTHRNEHFADSIGANHLCEMKLFNLHSETEYQIFQRKVNALNGTKRRTFMWSCMTKWSALGIKTKPWMHVWAIGQNNYTDVSILIKTSWFQWRTARNSRQRTLLFAWHHQRGVRLRTSAAAWNLSQRTKNI